MYSGADSDDDKDDSDGGDRKNLCNDLDLTDLSLVQTANTKMIETPQVLTSWSNFTPRTILHYYQV